MEALIALGIVTCFVAAYCLCVCVSIHRVNGRDEE
jgi:hypothetical protein